MTAPVATFSRGFAFVWYEQGVMLSKGRLRPADADEVVQRNGGRPGDLIVYLAVHEDAAERYAQITALSTVGGPRWFPNAPVIVDTTDDRLGRLARLPEGAHELKKEEITALNLLLPEDFHLPSPEDKLEEVEKEDAEALADSRDLARAAGIPLDPLYLLAGFLRHSALTATIDISGYLLLTLVAQRKLETKIRDPIATTHALLQIEDRSLQPAPERLVASPPGTDRLLIERLIAAARVIRARVSPTRPLGTRHFLAVLLGARDADLSAVPHLQRLGFSISELRRDLVKFFERTRLDETWAGVLTVSSGFDLANRISTDLWTRDDTLGYAKYARAISDAILSGNAPPPLTIGIQAPWGQGKTSLMRMIQARLDPDCVTREAPQPATEHATYGDVRQWLRYEDRPDGMLAVRPGIPTVWFNPLYYRETTQVWAGLAHAILHQLVQQLDTAKLREEFWLRLQMARVNVAVVRRDIHLWLLTRAVPRGLFWLVVAALLAVNRELLAAGGMLLAGALHVWQTLEKRTVDHKFEKYLSEPAYQTELGLLHLVDYDLDRALRLLVGSRRIAVFIDDLDRCDPQTVNQIVLAINQFLSLPNRNVYFILGMDMEVVATSLELAQKNLPQLARPGRSFGWRFMEKFVQLPFVIPHLDPKTARRFAAAHLRGDTPPAKVDLQERLASVDRAVAPVEIGAIAREIAAADDLDPTDRAHLEEKLSQKTTELMRDADGEEIRGIVELAIDDLELNPRTIKRYFCLVRVLRNVQIAVGAVTDAQHDRKLVLRTAHLLLNWPQFVQWIRNEPQRIAELETIAGEAKSNTEWCAALKELLGSDPPGYLSDPALQRYLNKLAAEAPGLGTMYEARLF